MHSLIQKKYNNLIGNSVFIFLNRFFYTIASLLVMFFFAHQLTQAAYGQYQAFWAQLNVFNAVAGVGITLFSLTYPPDKILLFLKSIRPGFFGAYFLFLLACCCLFGWLQIENNLSFLEPVLFLAAFALCNISDALLIAFRKFTPLLILNFFYATVFFGIHYIFLIRTFDLNALIAWLMPLLLLKLLISAWILYKYSRKHNKINSGKNQLSFRGMYSLWGHLYFYDILQIASLWIDKFIISLFMDSKETAIYINGTLNIPFLPILFTALTGSALIQLSHHNKDTENRLEVVNHVGKILSSVAFPLCVFLIFFRTEFITLCFSEKYLASVPIFLCAILILPFRAYGHTILLQNLEQGKIINQGAILDVLAALVLMYPFYLLLGLPGVALSFVFSTFIQVVFYGYHTQKLLSIPFWRLFPLKNWIFKAFLFTTLGSIIYFSLKGLDSGFIRLLIGGCIMAAMAAVTFFIELKNGNISRPEPSEAERIL